MKDNIEIQKLSDRSKEIDETLSQSGKFEIIENPIYLEWEKISGKSLKLTEKIQALREILIETYSKMEIQFAREFPSLVPNEMFLKSLAPLFKDGIDKVDWNLAQLKINGVFEHFFTQADFANFAEPGDINLFVVAKDKVENKPTGMIQFLIKPEYDWGHVRVCFYGTLVSETLVSNNARDIEKLLMSSIYRLLPATKRIFLHTRITNENLIHAYRSWGFNDFAGPLEHWIDLEYLSEKSDFLQKTNSINFL